LSGGIGHLAVFEVVVCVAGAGVRAEGARERGGAARARRRVRAAAPAGRGDGGHVRGAAGAGAPGQRAPAAAAAHAPPADGDGPRATRRRGPTQAPAGPAHRQGKAHSFDAYPPPKIGLSWKSQVVSMQTCQRNPEQPKVFGVKFSLGEIGKFIFIKIRNFKL